MDYNDITFSGIVKIRDALIQKDNPLRLESGEPNFDTPEHIKEACTKALKDNHTHYAPSTGILPLREEILNKLQNKNKCLHIKTPDDIIVTSGGMHALYTTFQVILSPGDKILIPSPNWPAIAWMIRIAGGVPVGYSNLDEMKDLIETREFKAIFINSPHNPTGEVYNKQDLREILFFAAEYALWVVSDEAYEDIIYTNDTSNVMQEVRDFSNRDKIVACYTFSKSYAMTGWRLGYLACSNKEFIKNIKKAVLYSINGVSTPTQYAGLAALQGSSLCIRKMLLEYMDRRNILYDHLKDSKLFDCDLPEGTFYMYATVKGMKAEELTDFLVNEYSLGCIPGSVFGDKKETVRFSYACDTGQVIKAAKILKGL